MPTDPPDLGLVLLLHALHAARNMGRELAAQRPADEVLGAAVNELEAVVARFEAHPDAPAAEN
jgi:hypothetical protein